MSRLTVEDKSFIGDAIRAYYIVEGCKTSIRDRGRLVLERLGSPVSQKLFEAAVRSHESVQDVDVKEVLRRGERKGE